MAEALKQRPDDKQEKKQRKEEKVEKQLDKALEDSFPNSDPLAIVQPGGPADPGKKKDSGQH